MADNLTPAQRRHNMSQIRSRDTRPEKTVRAMIHRMGYRYALHRRDLPGKPDIVLSSRKKVVFVHGCFWHLHRCRKGRVTPQANAEYWQSKRIGTVARDRSHVKKLRKDGWEVLTVWECETRKSERLERILSAFLN